MEFWNCFYRWYLILYNFFQPGLWKKPSLCRCFRPPKMSHDCGYYTELRKSFENSKGNICSKSSFSYNTWGKHQAKSSFSYLSWRNIPNRVHSLISRKDASPIWPLELTIGLKHHKVLYSALCSCYSDF